MCAPFFRLALFSGLLGLVQAFAGCNRSSAPAARPLRVAAAADLEPAFRELGRRYSETSGGRQVVFSFASSSLLAQQVEKGAPFDLFAAASAVLIDRLEANGQIVRGSKRAYARGRLVFYGRPNSEPPASLQALTDARYGRIAVANPEHAPYGQAAVEALRNAGLYETLKSRLIFGENVRQAHQYVATGNADIAIGARSLLTETERRYTEVPQSLYSPLLQVLGVVSGGDAVAANQFAALILKPEGQAILARYGFLPPVETKN